MASTMWSGEERGPSHILLALATLLHFAVDGVCAANLARYAWDEPRLEPILLYFGIYNLIAFGGQWAMGWWLDCRSRHIAPSLILSSLLLAAGCLEGLGILWQAVFLALGNCLFHSAGGSLILRGSRNFSEPGIFVSSGAVGLALGLYGFCGITPFLLLCLAGGAALAALVHFRGLPEFAVADPIASDEAAPRDTGTAALVFAAFLLLACVVLRGANGGGTSGYVLLFPCVFALGKVLGGLCADHFGYNKTVLAIFLLGFLALQWQGLLPALLLALSWNMTMPLTLRLLHRCRPDRPGLMFGLAAGCLLPGYFFREHLTVLPGLLIVLQFLALSFTGWLLLVRGAAGTGGQSKSDSSSVP
ncbi:MAG: hypothetical protein IJM72_07160 [Deltaproteobacteria bacterium]|nr:hypothetical protein [Deltaproteobacteria bacterium]